MRTITRWIKHEEFESRQDENKIKLDGKKKHGISPKAVLLSGLAACSGIDVVEILQKMRVEFSSLEIETEAEMTEETPKIFRQIEVLFKIKTDPVNKDKVIKAIELSLNKYCGVATMLRKNSPIDYQLIIED
jgi:putative redox protein